MLNEGLDQKAEADAKEMNGDVTGQVD